MLQRAIVILILNHSPSAKTSLSSSDFRLAIPVSSHDSIICC